MCGQCGIYGMNISASELGVFHRLLYLNQWRGEDSTGVLRLNKKQQPNILRMIEPSSSFIRSDLGKKFLSHSEEPMMMLGHCRAATKGTVTPANAHPFQFDHIVGTHNGTIHGDFEGKKDFGTDSEALYSLIDKHGLKEGIDRALQYDHTGAYALTYWDRDENTLNFITNGKRPLHFAYIGGTTTLIWSSTREMLELACSVGNNTMKGYGVNPTDDVWTLFDNSLFSIKIGKPASDSTFTPITIKPLAPPRGYKAPVSTSGYAMGYDDWGPEWNDYINGAGEYPPKKKTQTTNTGSSAASSSVNLGKHDEHIYVKSADGRFRTRAQEAERVESLFHAGGSTAETPKLPPPEAFGPPGDNRPKDPVAKTTSVKGPQHSGDRKANRSAGKGKANTGTGESKGDHIDPREDNDGDLTALAWLHRGTTGAKTYTEEEKFEFAALAMTGSKSDANRPKTVKALKENLACGCAYCGTIISSTDIDEVKRVRWWSSTRFACGDCFDSSPGDWVRLSIEDDWGLGAYSDSVVQSVAHILH